MGATVNWVDSSVQFAFISSIGVCYFFFFFNNLSLLFFFWIVNKNEMLIIIFQRTWKAVSIILFIKNNDCVFCLLQKKKICIFHSQAQRETQHNTCHTYSLHKSTRIFIIYCLCFLLPLYLPFSIFLTSLTRALYEMEHWFSFYVQKTNIKKKSWIN